MKIYALNNNSNGTQTLAVNLVDRIVLSGSGDIIGVAHVGRKLAIAYGPNQSMAIMRYLFKGFAVKWEAMPSATISNWNNTLWEAVANG